MAQDPTDDKEYSAILPLIGRDVVRSEFNGGKMFLPFQSFQSLFARDKIEAELPGASKELIDFVSGRATKTFATVLLALVAHPKYFITSAMESFKINSFDDSFLPIDRRQLASCPHECGGHKSALNVFHNSPLKQCISLFSTYQWIFLAPRFPLAKDLRVLDRDCILPFTEYGGIIRGGTFSEIRRAKIRVDHQAVIPQASGPSEVYVAVKKFKSKEKISLPESEIPDPRHAWSCEADSMEEFATSNFANTHITRVIGSFSTNGEYYIIMPWAMGGTLREFWEHTNPCPELCGTLIADFLEQYMNLAESLCDLHCQSNSQEGLENTSFPVPQGHPQAQNSIPNREGPDIDIDRDGSNWRHGNLKPDNILRKQDGDRLGPLMIGDVGLAKKHKDRTLTRLSTNTRLGTMDYEPPEAFDNSRPKSRAYDIWSMGCIIIETIVWLLYGNEGQKRFYNEPYNPTTGTRYYTTQETFPERKLNDNVLKWVGHMLNEDPECNRENPSSALRDLLNLAGNELLVVNPPKDYDNPGKDERINAETFRARLRDIIRRSKDDAYLFTGVNRERVPIPDFTDPSQTQEVGLASLNQRIAAKF
ncbi:hypothetical protein ANO14919_081570 [Xylariales sp. No.14919]|nr:hypothetical protein ANO14919_081570 [Xylariales sp. No.14919]